MEFYRSLMVVIVPIDSRVKIAPKKKVYSGPIIVCVHLVELPKTQWFVVDEIHFHHWLGE